MNKKILVILVTYNIRENLVRCLDSLVAQTNQNFELYLVDNNSTDTTIDVITNYLLKHKRLHRKTEVIRNDINLGFAKAVNIGMRAALEKEDIYATLLLNQDVYFTPDLLENAIKTFDASPDAGAVVPKILYSDNKIWWMGTRILSDKELLFSPNYGITEHINKGEFVKANFPERKEVDAVTGCALFLRVAAIDFVGFLNEKYFMYAEDIDYSLRLKKRGYKLVLFTNSTVFHEVKDKVMNLKIVLGSLKKYKIYLTSVALYLLEYKPFYFFTIWFLKLPYALAYNYISRSLNHAEQR